MTIEDTIVKQLIEFNKAHNLVTTDRMIMSAKLLVKNMDISLQNTTSFDELNAITIKFKSDLKLLFQ